MLPMTVMIYAAISLVIGGLVATSEIWSPSPGRKINAIGLGLFVVICWPIIVIRMISDSQRVQR